MLSLRDMALTVEERGEGQFYWVVLEASEPDEGDVMIYRRIESAARAQPTYSNALALGVDVVRRLAD
ncbi:MAG: hypothetical protein REJ24_17990 [Rhodocyclaceae bacterium]|nr:hypothetical protein [Pseudomonadota bacterium]MDQ7974472.1 hypothetical protein [Rhodocyclaceae bacterium]MDQ8017234.1 hypothetical protein [Pseudomonadota bacterium]